jgi:hypothetical protein
MHCKQSFKTLAAGVLSDLIIAIVNAFNVGSVNVSVINSRLAASSGQSSSATSMAARDRLPSCSFFSVVVVDGVMSAWKNPVSLLNQRHHRRQR